MSGTGRPVPLTGTARKGAMALAITSTFSLVATSSFLTYVATLFVISRRRAKRSAWAKAKLAFLKTQFGTLLINLAVADFVQSLGMSINYHYLVTGTWASPSTACTVQGALIELGDAASAIANLLITLQTFSVLVLNRRVPGWITWAAIGTMWSMCVCFTLVSPTVLHAWSGSRNFYAWTGAWCWINAKYELYRLGIHYFWFFLSMLGSVVMYTTVFVRLRSHARRQGEPSTHSSDAPSQGLTANRKRQRTLQRTARRMLVYPTAFIALVLPVSIFRLAGYAGENLGLVFGSVAACMLSLSGFVDMLVFILTRKVLSGGPVAQRPAAKAQYDNYATGVPLRVNMRREVVVVGADECEAVEDGRSSSVVETVEAAPGAKAACYHDEYRLSSYPPQPDLALNPTDGDGDHAVQGWNVCADPEKGGPEWQAY